MEHFDAHQCREFDPDIRTGSQSQTTQGGETPWR